MSFENLKSVDVAYLVLAGVCAFLVVVFLIRKVLGLALFCALVALAVVVYVGFVRDTAVTLP